MSSNSKICRYCGVLLNNPSSLKQHESRHKGEGPYKCCGKPFFSKANLKRHRCSKHGEPKDFKCTTCQKSYPTNTDLQRHIRAEKKQWSNTCDICDQRFPSKAKLNDHLDRHSGDKRHTCEICGHSFRYQTNLSRHMNTHKDN